MYHELLSLLTSVTPVITSATPVVATAATVAAASPVLLLYVKTNL